MTSSHPADDLLGLADDKVSVAAIMTAPRHRLQHPQIKHGEIRIAFTSDAERRGVDRRCFDDLQVEFANTLDGAALG
jgi:tripeptide aminopeptidase